MKKAALYARVSSDLQKRERTIESQIAVLKSQIKAAGDVLIKEYIDDGYSGARLDRPSLDELRRDVKIQLFDSIYFLNSDRIARDVTYQIIIIGEILKHAIIARPTAAPCARIPPRLRQQPLWLRLSPSHPYLCASNNNQ
jgi:DNA invertase Pin-like site-specific DNA recombinase